MNTSNHLAADEGGGKPASRGQAGAGDGHSFKNGSRLCLKRWGQVEVVRGDSALCPGGLFPCQQAWS